MNTWHGYTGKILDVNLTSATVSEAELDRSMAADYMGGKGFGAKILYDQLPPGCDPLSADNILVFATGPLTAPLRLPADALKFARKVRPPVCGWIAIAAVTSGRN